MRERYPDKSVWQHAPPIVSRYSLHAEKIAREAYGIDKEHEEPRMKNVR